MLQKQARAPLRMLSCLGGVEEEKVEQVVNAMRELSTCRVKGREVDGKEMMEIQILDLIHDYCVAQTQKHEGSRGVA